MSTQIRFLGIAAFEVTLESGQVVMIDPCLDANPASPVSVNDLPRADLILITHLAADHLGEAGAIARRLGSHVVCGNEVKYHLKCQGVDPERIHTVPWHGQVNPLGIRVRSVPSMHNSTGVAPDGQWLCGVPMGFILYASDDCRVYHSGDSAIFSDLRLIGRLYKPTVGLMCACELEHEYLQSLGIRFHFGNEMSGREGALAARWLKLDVAVCCHYLDPEGREDVREFFKELAAPTGPKPSALKAGEILHYPLEE